MTAISREEFEAMVQEAFVRLPEKFRMLVKNVAILVEESVDEKTRKKLKLSPQSDLLGLYTGVPRTKRSNDAGFAYPDVITLYKTPLERHAQELGKTLPDVIYETLWHEIGHHFGLDEKGVRKREREKFKNERG
ncbi:MAG: metallopeptidase family protein [Candidatus Campbellbacteria bacterium]|nr:metallopeptidase family protein [Candidatus Campbellbacteria bacterium]